MTSVRRKSLIAASPRPADTLELAIMVDMEI